MKTSELPHDSQAKFTVRRMRRCSSALLISAGLMGVFFLLLVSSAGTPLVQVVQAAPAIAPRPAPPTAEPGFVPQVFANETTKVSAVATGDLNGDGFLDLVLGNENAHNEVYLNDPSGSFDTPIRLPFGPVTGTTQLAVADMNSDGQLDVVIGNKVAGNLIYLNNGSGDFTQALTATFGLPGDNYTALAVGDMDGNATYDIVVGRKEQPNQILYNTVYSQTPYFTTTNPITFGPEAGHTQSLALGRLDNDETLDIVVGTSDANDAVYFNKGRTEIIARDLVPAITNRKRTSSVVLGDFDSDRDLDVVATYMIEDKNSKEQTIYNSHYGFYYNDYYDDDRVSNLLICRDQPLARNDDRRSYVKDVNGDGYPDIILGPINENWYDAVLLNYSSGEFSSCKPTFALATEISTKDLYQKWGVATGDLDNDGALDLLVSFGTIKYNRILLNDGYGNFSRRKYLTLGTNADDTHAVAMADMNNDGRLDLVSGNTGKRSAIYLNSGSANFVNAPNQTIGDTNNIRAIAVADINKDGYLDIVAGRGFDAGGDWIKEGDLTVYVKNLSGDFDPHHFNPLNTTTWSIAVGDLDNDGWLEVITVNRGQANLIYYNLGKDLNNKSPMTETFGEISDNTLSVAVGDINADGYLDIIAGNSTKQSTIYFNNKKGKFLKELAYTLTDDIKRTESIAIGDINADGSLDIVAGNKDEPSLVFINDGHGGFPKSSIRRFGAKIGNTLTVALGDINSDGALDIVMGNFDEVNYVFLNDGEGNFPPTLAYPIDRNPSQTYSIAVGDINGDGFQDVVAGNWPSTKEEVGAQNIIYLNDGTGKFTVTPFRLSDYTRGIALGDLNNDGTLDVVVGNRYASPNAKASPPVGIYLTPSRSENALPGLLPIVTVSRPVTTGNADFYSSPTMRAAPLITIPYQVLDQNQQPMPVRFIRGCYSRVGGGGWQPAIAAGQSASTPAITTRYGCPYISTTGAYTPSAFLWNTFASGLFGRSEGVVFRIEAYPDLKPAPHGVPGPYQYAYATAATFPFRVQGTQVRTKLNGAYVTDEIIYKAPAVSVAPGESTGAVSASAARAETVRSLAPELHAQAADGTGGDQLVAIWPLTDVVALPTLPVKTYLPQATWPLTVPVGNNTEITLTVPDARRITEIATWVDLTHTYGISAVMVLVPPRGAPVTLVDGPLVGNGLAREWHGQTLDAGTAQAPAIQATGELSSTLDQLANGTWKLQMSITTTNVVTPIRLTNWGLALRLSPVFLTSAQPITSGLDMQRVTSPGIQPLTLTLTNTLTLFDLNVALEWDASPNELLVKRLTSDIQRASALLYDWTNGQAALGRITIYQDGKRNRLPNGLSAWTEADVRIYASNRLRPNADQGGVISQIFSETVTISLPHTSSITHTQIATYTPGQARMGVEWNRYGEATGNLGDDWARAFAHELGHYLFFLDDNYIGLVDEGSAGQGGGVRKRLVTINDSACPGAMNNPYSDLHSEFHPEAGWYDEHPGMHSCQDTFSHRNLGRADWETIQHFYPWLMPPTGSITETNSGPAILPLPVTEIAFIKPLTLTQPLTLPIFYLYQEHKPYYASPRARAFLKQEQPDGRMIDLGQPTRDQIFAHGARPNDTICIFDLLQEGDYFQNCAAVQPGIDRIELDHPSQWQPAVMVAPVITSMSNISVTSLYISVTLPSSVSPTMTLYGRLYPVDAPASSEFTFTQTLSGTAKPATFSYRFDTAEPILEGHVDIWTDTCNSAKRCEIITDFTVGGNLVSKKGRHVSSKGRHTNLRARHTPVSSSDGQVVVYIDDAVAAQTDREWLFTIQPAAALPEIPSWATVVGKAYWLNLAPQTFTLTHSSLSFEYLGSDVPPGTENSLQLYRWNEHTRQWYALSNLLLNTEQNIISAPIDNGGLYALIASLAMPLKPAWNLLGYPVQNSEAITQVLQPIAGDYAVVYTYVGGDEPWQYYTPDVDITNTLTTVQFQSGYWIYVTATQTSTLYLRSSYTTTAAAVSLSGGNLLRPPTLYFGHVKDSPVFTPTVGMEVTVAVNGTACMSGTTHLLADQQIGYVVIVEAAGEQAEQCGRKGAVVTFTVDGQPMMNWAIWEDIGIQRLDLVPK